jgi:CheY-like chemotaxis protein
MEQVLLNLFVNASQAMPAGGKLQIQTENVSLDPQFVNPFNLKAGKYTKVSVRDTGVGMDEATQRRIFEPFFTTKEMGRGTGLGLASAYGIIKNHSGFISVSSKKGQGSTFYIYLPASDRKVQEGKTLSNTIFRGLGTFLLVDDEEMILDVGKEMLTTIGYEVLMARSGKEAIALYKENHAKIDMVILDMIMPDMGGGEVFDRLKRINPGIKVLLSSGYSIDGQATEIIERGCSGFIQKPFNIKQLSEKAKEILG